MTDEGTPRTWFDEYEKLSPAEIARRLQDIWHPPGQMLDYMNARREALTLFAQARLADETIAAVNGLRKTGRGLTVVGVILAAVQAWPVFESWVRALFAS